MGTIRLASTIAPRVSPPPDSASALFLTPQERASSRLVCVIFECLTRVLPADDSADTVEELVSEADTLMYDVMNASKNMVN